MQYQSGLYYEANPVCPAKDGCPPGVCPDALLKRHDTRPSFKVLMETCDGVMDLTDESLVVEVSLWSRAKLKTTIAADATYFQLADHIGFEQILVGDIIILDRVRLPEHMLVTGFDEANHLVQVQRGYNGTTASVWKKGTVLRIFREMGATAGIESIVGDVVDETGATLTDQLLETYLTYDWAAKDTCTPGCYWLEFKLLKMVVEEEDVSILSTDEISNISFVGEGLSYTDYGCLLGEGVEWVRRFPSNGEGFLIKVVDSATAEI